MYIYKITNLINGKQYIGQTTRTVEERLKEHRKRGTLSKAMKKHGLDNFKVEVLARAESIEELNQLEIDFIREFKTFGKKGYNLCEGGGNTFGYRHSEGARKRMSESRSKLFTGEDNHFYGKRHTDDAKRRMSEAHKGLACLSEEQIRNLRASHSKRRVRNMTTNETFDSIKEAAAKFKVPATNISRACRQPTRTAAKCFWEYV